MTAAGALEFGGQFDALRLTTAEFRRGLPQPQVPQSHLAQRLQTAEGGRDGGQERGGGVDGQLQHFRDVLVAVGDFQGFGVVPGALAGRARRVGAGKEQQFDRDESFALAGLSPPFGHVEGEPPGRVAARLGLVRRRVQLAHRVEHPRVRGKVYGSSAHGPLVGLDAGVGTTRPPTVSWTSTSNCASSGSSGTSPRWPRTTSASTCVTSVDCPEPDTPVTAVSTQSGTSTDTSRRLWRETPLRCSQPCGVRGGDQRLGAPEQVLARGRLPDPLKTGDRAAVQHAPAALTRAGADVHHPVRPPYDVHVVLHDEQRVARRLEAVQHVQQRFRVSRVQAGGGFVEDVDDAEQPRAQLGGDPQALRLAGRQGRRAAPEAEISEAQVEQYVDPRDQIAGAPGPRPRSSPRIGRSTWWRRPRTAPRRAAAAPRPR